MSFFPRAIRWRITDRGATNSVDRGSKYSIRWYISRLGWESLGRRSRCNKRRMARRRGLRNDWRVRHDWRNRARGGSFRDGDGTPFRSHAMPSLSPSARPYSPSFFLPSASFHLSSLPPSRPLLPTCAFVYTFSSVVARISVWSGSGGFVVMTTNPGNPAALSHPLWISRGSLSIRSPFSLFPMYMFITIFLHPHWQFSGPFTETFFFLFASLSLSLSLLSLILYSAATPIPATRPWLLRALLCARVRAPYIYHVHAAYVCAILQTAARFIHLLGSVPGCCTPPSPSARVVAPGPTLLAIPEPAWARELRQRREGGGGGREWGRELDDFEYEEIGSTKMTKCNKNISSRENSFSSWNTLINSTHSPKESISIDGSFYVHPYDTWQTRWLP